MPCERPLLITPHPNLDESLKGYLLRLTDANGYPNCDWLLRSLEISPKDVLSPGDIAILARASRQGAGLLRSLQCGQVKNRPRWRSFKEHEVHGCTIECNLNQVCPECLKTRGYMRGVWMLKPLTACPEHGIYLQEECSACKKPLRWNRERLLQCGCGQDLRSLPVIKAPQNTISFCAAIAAALYGGENNTQRPDCFRHMGLSELLISAELLAAYVSGRGRGTGRRLHYKINSDASREVFDRTAAIIAGWPGRFHEVLDEIRQHAEAEPDRTGLQAEFNSFYAALYGRTYESKFWGQIRTEFERYLTSQWNGGLITPKNKRLGTNVNDEKKYVSLGDAANRLGMHESILRRDMDNGLLKGVTRNMQSRVLRMIEVEELERYRNLQDQLITTEDLIARLGISKQPVLRLVHAGIIKAIKGPTVDGSAHWAFKSSDVDKLLTMLTGRLFKIKNRNAYVSFSTAVRKCTAKGICISDLVTALINKELRASFIFPEENGLAALCFNENALNAFFYNEKRTIKWAMSIEAAARHLHLNEEATRDLVRQGLLATTLVHEDGRLKRQVSIDSIQQFWKIYISASKLAVRRKTSPKAVVADLISRGVMPVTGPSVDQCRQYFFYRRDVYRWPVYREAKV